MSSFRQRWAEVQLARSIQAALTGAHALANGRYGNRDLYDRHLVAKCPPGGRKELIPPTSMPMEFGKKNSWKMVAPLLSLE